MNAAAFSGPPQTATPFLSRSVPVPDCPMPTVAIEKVIPENFDEFLQLIENLAEYEGLAPPDEDARKRLRADALSDRPPFEAYLA
ncbi:MAG: hypothetical protein GKC04_03205, partial [Methanomicrobiales archaeon]|nr:hypothetical protein [Methanomicrobiales archaeon]